MTVAEIVEDSVDVAGLAKILNCSADKVYRMRRSGEIPYFRVGRAIRFFPTKVVDALSAPKPSWQQSKRSTARRRRA